MRTWAGMQLRVADACSRDGVAIAEGLVMLFRWTLIVVTAVLVLAVVSGWIVGRRRGAPWRQAGRHALWGMTLLIVGTALALLVMSVKDSLDREHYARERLAYEAWLAPLAAPAPGALDQALRQVLAGPIHNPLYLAGELPARLAPLDGPLTPDEEAALRDAAARLRREVLAAFPKASPDIADRLDGAVAWRIAKPGVTPALDVCGARRGCLHEVLHSAERWCVTRAEACRAAQAPGTLEALATRFHGDPELAWLVEALAGALQPRAR